MFTAEVRERQGGTEREREHDHAVRRRWREHTPVVDVGSRLCWRQASEGRGKMDDDDEGADALKLRT